MNATRHPSPENTADKQSESGRVAIKGPFSESQIQNLPSSPSFMMRRPSAEIIAEKLLLGFPFISSNKRSLLISQVRTLLLLVVPIWRLLDENADETTQE